MEKIYLIIAIVTTILSAGLLKLATSFVKESKEAIKAYKDAMKDKKITEEEEKIIMKESIEAIESGLKLGFAVRKAFGLAKKKINKKS